MSRRYDAVIFDLDGTLLDTLEDLTNAVNHALREDGYPERTRDEVRSFVGNGVSLLMRRALPVSADGDGEAFEEALQTFKSYYRRHNNDATRPYAGIGEMLDALSAAGVRLAVVSNKNDPNVQALTQSHFSGRITLAIGEREGVRAKPHPDTVLKVMRQWRSDPTRTLYVGDSGVDIQTARNAGVDCASVTWGFCGEETLREGHPKIIVHTPDELTRFVLGE